MKRFLVVFAVGCALGTALIYASDKMLVVTQEQENVFLADKMGDPPVSVTFQVDPTEGVKRPFCIGQWYGGYHQWERPWNIAVINGAKRGDLLKVSHITYAYKFRGKTLLQTHEDIYWVWPVPRKGVRQIYPPQTWPLNLEDPKAAYQPFGSGT